MLSAQFRPTHVRHYQSPQVVAAEDLLNAMRESRFYRNIYLLAGSHHTEKNIQPVKILVNTEHNKPGLQFKVSNISRQIVVYFTYKSIFYHNYFNRQDIFLGKLCRLIKISFILKNYTIFKSAQQ